MNNSLNHSTKKEPETLLFNEIDSLLAEARDSGVRDFMMIDLALNTGLRNSEICSLTIELVYSFDIVPSILVLPGSISKGNYPRDIPLNPDIREHLKQYMTWKTNASGYAPPDSFLFTSKFTGNKLSPRDFQRICSTLSQKAIGRSIYPHILRHTFATRLLSVSNLRIVQKVLGHKNIQSTQIYTHPSNSDVSEAINKL